MHDHVSGGYSLNRKCETSTEKLRALVRPGTIDKALKLIAKPESASDIRMQWYLRSYPVFKTIFSQSATQDQESAWIQRVACVFSWVARIPTPNMELPLLERLTRVQSTYKNEKLWKGGFRLNVASVVEPDKLLHEDNPKHGAKPIALRYFLEPANKLLNGSNHWDKNLPTTTKLLHFMCPYLFPILDKRIVRILSVGKMPNYNTYNAYVLALQSFLVESTGIVNQIETKGENPLRLIDIILLMNANGEE